MVTCISPFTALTTVGFPSETPRLDATSLFLLRTNYCCIASVVSSAVLRQHNLSQACLMHVSIMTSAFPYPRWVSVPLVFFYIPFAMGEPLTLGCTMCRCSTICTRQYGLHKEAAGDISLRSGSPSWCPLSPRVRITCHCSI